MDKSTALIMGLISIFALSTAPARPAQAAQSYDIGFRIDASKLDSPDFYYSDTETGQRLKSLYVENAWLRKQAMHTMPPGFDPVIEVIHDFIQKHSEQKNKRSKFYVGPNGKENSDDFDFSPQNLPTKLTRLAFCFGFDPFVFTGLLKQESRFKRKARSSTGAVGFTQLTSAAISEVSEQLGLLGPSYHGSGAPEIFQQYISCYLGPNKNWVNMWEDGTIPSGSGAYVNKKLGSGRDWKYHTTAKNWLNEDPDRNLIYGAVLFKLYLGHYGSYSRALTQYNVSHANIYANRVKSFYGQMLEPFRASPPAMDEIVVYGKRINMSGIELEIDGLLCVVNIDDIAEDIQLAETLDGLYSVEEVRMILKNIWEDKGFCRSKKGAELST